MRTFIKLFEKRQKQKKNNFKKNLYEKFLSFLFETENIIDICVAFRAYSFTKKKFLKINWSIYCLYKKNFHLIFIHEFK